MSCAGGSEADPGAVGRQLLQRGAQAARHADLRGADAFGDLGLRQVVLEAQPQDLARAAVEDRGQALDRGARLRALVLHVVVADQLADRIVERPERAVAAGAQRLGDLLRRPVEPLGELGDGGPGEDPLDIDGDAALLRLGTNGERKDRVSADGEEVVVDPDGFDFED